MQRLVACIIALVSIAAVAHAHCGSAYQGQKLSLGCNPGEGVISAITFASYGLPLGDDDRGYGFGWCHSKNSKAVVEAACLGKQSCTVPASNDYFGGDPCSFLSKKLAFAFTCNAPVRSAAPVVVVPKKCADMTSQAKCAGAAPEDASKLCAWVGYACVATATPCPKTPKGCADMTDAASCTATACGDGAGRMCAWANKVCACAPSTAASPTPPLSRSAMLVATPTGVPTSSPAPMAPVPAQCADIADEVSCRGWGSCPEDASQSCAWVNSACRCGTPPPAPSAPVTSCASLTDEVACVQQQFCPENPTQTCGWVNGGCQCGSSFNPVTATSCADFTDQFTCVSQSFCPEDTSKVCAWMGGACTCTTPAPATCADISDQQTCQQTSACPDDPSNFCAWVNSACQCGLGSGAVTWCSNLTTKGACEVSACPEDASRSCSWTGSGAGGAGMCSCPLPTPTPTATATAPAPKVATRCSDLTDKTACSSTKCPDDTSKWCSWVPSSNVCACSSPTPKPAPKCSDFANQYACEACSRCPEDSTNKCRWSNNKCSCGGSAPTPAPVTTAWACTAKSPSGWGQTPVSCTFVNKRERKVVVQWCDASAKTITYQMLDKDQQCVQPTYGKHVWGFVDAGDYSLVQNFTVPSSGACNVIIGGSTSSSSSSGCKCPAQSASQYGQQVQMTVYNRLSKRAMVKWCSASGDSKQYCDLSPGETCNIDSYAGHAWMMTDVSGQVLYRSFTIPAGYSRWAYACS